jgi:TatD DNase family protein
MQQAIAAEMVTSPIPLIDGHTHVDQYVDAEIEGLLSRAHAAGVGAIIAAGTTLDSCARVLALAHLHPIIRAGVGLHPMDLTGPIDGPSEAQLRAAASNPAVVVWSETGLDYLPASPDHALQQDAFRAQIRIAKELGLPLVVHSRNADADTVRLLREEHATDVGGAWHYFGGDMALAEAVLDLGFMVSLAKPLLREPALQEVAGRLPMDRLVIETDAYPQHFKKKRERWTEPWQLPQVAAKLAELHGASLEQVARATTANYLRMVGERLSAADLPLPIA